MQIMVEEADIRLGCDIARAMLSHPALDPAAIIWLFDYNFEWVLAVFTPALSEGPKPVGEMLRHVLQDAGCSDRMPLDRVRAVAADYWPLTQPTIVGHKYWDAGTEPCRS